jgi:hypothetical protein
MKLRDEMRDRLEARRLEIAMELANSGNVGALKELGKMIERSDQMILQRRLTGDKDPARDDAPRKAPPAGKKDSQVEAAKRAAGADPLLQPGLLN